MMKSSQNRNRPIFLFSLAILTLLLAAIAWIAASSLSPTTTIAASPQLISPAQYQSQFNPAVEHALIDVRTPEEYATGHIQGSVNINVESLPDRLGELPDGIPIVVYCRSGNRSATAARILADAGFSPVYDLGGIQDWISAGLPLE